MVNRGISGAHQLTRAVSGHSRSQESREACLWSFPVGSVRQHDGGSLHQSSGRYALNQSLSSGSRSLGMVHPERDFSLGSSHPGSGECGGRFLVRGQFLSVLVIGFLRDLSSSRSSPRDRFVRVLYQPPTSPVLCKKTGPAGLEYGCSIVPVVGSATMLFLRTHSSPRCWRRSP